MRASAPPAGDAERQLGPALSLAVALAAAALLAAAPAASGAGPLETAVFEESHSGQEADLAFSRTRTAGAKYVRLVLDWAAVAPRRPRDGSNHADAAYRWDDFDRQVRMAATYCLRPLVTIDRAPAWAQAKPRGAVQPDRVDRRYRGPFRPSPREYGRFARAAATRYSGAVAGLPRIAHWQAWNEPNISSSLMPQFIGGRPASPAWYRDMVNAFAAAVHAVRADNVVVAGGLSPFTVSNRVVVAMGPLRFMRELLCLGKGKRPRPTCRARVQFDVWSHHPYTSGGPTHRAFRPDDVSLGDLGEMRALLDAGVRAGKVVSRQRVRFWVTEFSWDTRPPDPRAVPVKLHARWVAEAMYRMWEAGVSLVTWFQLRDDPYPSECCQSGLYFRGGSSLIRDQAKPALAAFRFPFVAFARPKGRALVWGRTPAGAAERVVIEQKTRRGWTGLAVVRTDRFGIFRSSVKLAAGGARLVAGRPSRQAGAYRDAVMADAPLSYWRLGERSGPAARDETGARTGTYSGGVKLGVGGAIARDPDKAVSLDGRDDRVALGAIASPRTVELWLKTESVATAAAFSNRNGISHYTFVGSVGAGNALAFDTLGLLGARWVSDGRWHHLVYTYGGAEGRLYVDGELDGFARWTRLEGGGPATLGYDATLKTYLRGSLDEVAVYDKALSEAQVKRHFQASGRPTSAAEPFALAGSPPHLRARLVNRPEASLPFSLKRPPDRYVLPFGS